MSLRRSSYVAPKSPRGGSKTQIGWFPSKIALRLNLKEVCYKVSLCENCQRQSCTAFIGPTIHAKIIGGGVPFYLKFWVKLTALERNCRFSIIFARSASAVTSSEKVKLSLIGSPLRAFQWAQYEHRTLSLSPQRVAQKRKVSKIWTISCDNSATLQDMLSVTITNSKSHTKAHMRLPISD